MVKYHCLNTTQANTFINLKYFIMRKNNYLLLAGLIMLTTACKKQGQLESLGAKSETRTKLKTVSSPVGDVVGKVTVGYQGWFSAAGDGSPFNSWQHTDYESWPDMREYTASYGNMPFNQGGVGQPPYTGNLGNGEPARMFSSYDQQVSNIHCLWMQQNGIDCIALQRFGSATIPNTPKKAFFDGILTHMKTAAETYGRKFYVMYDCNATDAIDTDWTNTIINTLHLTSSSAYAYQNGKPVVCLYGIGKDSRGTAADWLTKINWFKNQGCYVIVATFWGFPDKADYYAPVNAGDMVLPWAVGRVPNSDFQGQYTKDLTYGNAHGLDIQEDIFPGFSYNNSNTSKPFNEVPRLHGDFMWKLFVAAKNAGVTSIYISMFDEINEGTQIMKTAEDASMIPAGKQFLTLDADGTHVSSDFYLRLTNDGGKMIKGLIPLTTTVPTPFLGTTYTVDNCEALTGWTSQNTLSLNTGDKKQGTASLQSAGSGTLEFQKHFTSFNPGATAANGGTLQFWYYVSDVTQLGTSNQIELGSGGNADINEYNWNIGPLVNGWNFISKTFSSAGITGGTPNVSALNWLRIYHSKTGSVTTKIDDIQIVH